MVRALVEDVTPDLAVSVCRNVLAAMGRMEF